MTTKLEDAEARYRADPGQVWRLRDDARQIANVAARRHPAGHAAIYAEVNSGIAAAGFYPAGGEQLLAMEAVHAAMMKRQEEADAEVAQQRQAHEAMATERRRELMAGGCISRPPRDPALLEAIHVAKLRLDHEWPRLGDGSETDFRSVLDAIETAMKSLASSVGVARRSSNARSRAAAATDAVAAAKAAVSIDAVPPTQAAA